MLTTTDLAEIEFAKEIKRTHDEFEVDKLICKKYGLPYSENFVETGKWSEKYKKICGLFDIRMVSRFTPEDGESAEKSAYSDYCSAIVHILNRPGL
ncbi:hypothetical protein FACS1894139_17710 [Planctomycetales bacterium]|nr:hypothetical protein FACS1894107_14830 [Planctomycetales bacterium]GHT00846.1 hypothetical protein FACS1894108_13870 [Planctomycetales bacterium]GHT08249.1 hypothetical protein FACS1894139_17710 [Planctomycetales bacterium]